MSKDEVLNPDELRARAVRFYARYGKDLEGIRALLEIRLTQLALAYTIESSLPPEAIKVTTRVKTLSSFLKKLERLRWPQFYYPTQVAGDLIGARIVCWFLDDCYGFVDLIRGSNHLRVDAATRDYIAQPKPSGYRSIHLVGHVTYDSVRREGGVARVRPDEMDCEIQVRTKLQDAWGDVTHEFHYKAKDSGVDNRDYEDLLCDISDRLAVEDRTLVKFRDAYQRLAEGKLKDKTREGFRDD